MPSAGAPPGAGRRRCGPAAGVPGDGASGASGRGRCRRGPRWGSRRLRGTTSSSGSQGPPSRCGSRAVSVTGRACRVPSRSGRATEPGNGPEDVPGRRDTAGDQPRDTAPPPRGRSCDDGAVTALVRCAGAVATGRARPPWAPRDAGRGARGRGVRRRGGAGRLPRDGRRRRSRASGRVAQRPRRARPHRPGCGRAAGPPPAPRLRGARRDRDAVEPHVARRALDPARDDAGALTSASFAFRITARFGALLLLGLPLLLLLYPDGRLPRPRPWRIAALVSLASTAVLPCPAGRPVAEIDARAVPGRPGAADAAARPDERRDAVRAGGARRGSRSCRSASSSRSRWSWRGSGGPRPSPPVPTDRTAHNSDGAHARRLHAVAPLGRPRRPAGHGGGPLPAGPGRSWRSYAVVCLTGAVVTMALGRDASTPRPAAPRDRRYRVLGVGVVAIDLVVLLVPGTLLGGAGLRGGTRRSSRSRSSR